VKNPGMVAIVLELRLFQAQVATRETFPIGEFRVSKSLIAL
jgi:hypothetical protein